MSHISSMSKKAMFITIRYFHKKIVFSKNIQLFDTQISGKKYVLPLTVALKKLLLAAGRWRY
jgi:hypothetical protein